MAKRKVYDEDFKKMIVELYESKKPISEIKREYGLSEASLYRWIKEYGHIKTETGEITNNHEIKRLKKENLKLKEELEILKKAIAIFTPK
ncbi:MAG: transposase [Clostridia bacterium]|nr:transposase [Clostridia bacterium]